MRPVALFVALLATTAAAIRVTFPGERDKWTTLGPNLVDWESVSTDPADFKIVLTTRDLKTTELVAKVNTNEGSMVVSAPSGGFPAGDNYRVNLINTLTGAILAQSPEFSIVAGAGTVAATATSTNIPPTTMVAPPVVKTTSTTTPATGAATGTLDGSVLNPSESPAPAKNAASPAFKASGALLGLLAGVYALIL